jgi:hypothetical protein
MHVRVPQPDESDGSEGERRAAWDRFWNWALTERFENYYLADARRELLGVLHVRAEQLGVGR